MDLQRRVLRFVRARELIESGDHVLVAVSGGVDSIVLLHILKSQFQVSAAHFDHRMRAESAADAQWVRDLCNTWNIPLITSAADRVLRSETEARHERYRFLEDAAQQVRARRIATAHHADDQVETVLFRLLRGAGMRGLAGIPLRRGVFIRPLLPFTKDEIEAYARESGLEFREDASNADLKYARNRLRHLVIPLLRSTPAAIRSTLQLARHAAKTERAWTTLLRDAERDVVTTSSRKLVELARPALLAYDAELRKRLLRRTLRRFGKVPTRAATDELDAFVQRAESGSMLRLGDVSLERAFDTIRVTRARENSSGEHYLESNSGHARVQVGGRTFDIDWTGLPRAMCVRGFRPGDRIRLAYGTKKLKKLFAERRVPVSERESIPLLVDENGEVLYVHGIARAVNAPMPDMILNITETNAEPS